MQEALYRKYRPSSLEELVGQSDAVQIISTRKSQIAECSLNKKTKGTIIIDGFGSSDCYLFCKSHLKYMEN